MRPLTDTLPKPLLPLNGKALIEHQILRFHAAGFADFIINCGQFADKTTTYLESRIPESCRIRYSLEGEDILNTGGGISQALPLIKSQQFIVVNADVWLDYDVSQLSETHDSLAHLIMVPNPTHHPQGDFSLVDGRIHNTGENMTTFSGLGIYDKSLFIEKQGLAYPLTDILRPLADQGQLSGELHKGLWLDIGTPERLHEAESLLCDQPT